MELGTPLVNGHLRERRYSRFQTHIHTHIYTNIHTHTHTHINIHMYLKALSSYTPIFPLLHLPSLCLLLTHWKEVGDNAPKVRITKTAKTNSLPFNQPNIHLQKNEEKKKK